MKISITGHQNIGDKEVVNWVKKELRRIIKDLGNITNSYSSLAVGADQIFAEIMINSNINLTAVIPCEGYRNTFENDTVKDYDILLRKAEDVIVLDYSEPSEKAFYEAGKYVLNNCDILIAVWNGQKARGLGGTGDIVELAKKSRKKIFHINNENLETHAY